jgi:hypothetical protein
MEEEVKFRIRLAEIMALAILAIFIGVCFFQFMYGGSISREFILTTGVLFCSNANIFAIDGRNCGWHMRNWSPRMKLYMQFFIFFLVLVAIAFIDFYHTIS